MRDLTIARRADNLVDVLFTKLDGILSYRLWAATNFDATFTEILTAHVYQGYLDPSVAASKLHQQPLNSKVVRAVFNPATFTATAGITDDKPFWIQWAPINSSGVVGTRSSSIMVLPPNLMHGRPRIVIAGTVGAAANSAAATHFRLGKLYTHMLFMNNSSTVLYVSFTKGGPEFQVITGASPVSGDAMMMDICTQSEFWARTASGTTTFSLSMSPSYPE